jgi:hypothetical protein
MFFVLPPVGLSCASQALHWQPIVLLLKYARWRLSTNTGLAADTGAPADTEVHSCLIARSTHSAIHDNTLQLHCRDHDDTAGYRLPADKSFCPKRRRSGWSGIGCRLIYSSSGIPYLVLSCEHDEALSSHIHWSLPMQEFSSSEQAAWRPYSEFHRHN